MVVQSRETGAPRLDLGHLGLFLGLRVNELVMEKLRAAGFGHVRESHGYVVQHLIERERSITELAERMEVTQQAASKVVAELAGLGVVELEAGEDRRAKRVRLTARAWESVRVARRARRGIEKRLARAVGEGRYAEACSVVGACLEALGGMGRVKARRVRAPG